MMALPLIQAHIEGRNVVAVRYEVEDGRVYKLVVKFEVLADFALSYIFPSSILDCLSVVIFYSTSPFVRNFDDLEGLLLLLS